MSHGTENCLLSEAKDNWTNGVDTYQTVLSVMKMHPADQLAFIAVAARTRDPDTMILIRSLMTAAYTVGVWDAVERMSEK
jgi:hypothetical protein